MTTKPVKFRDVVVACVRLLTTHPNDIHLDVEDLGTTAILKLTVNKADMPRVLGARGAHANALNCICRAVGERMGKRLLLKILEPTKGQEARLPEFEGRDKWPQKDVIDLLQTMLRLVFEHPVVVTVQDSINFFTVITCRFDAEESIDRVTEMSEHFAKLWLAIGKMVGRRLQVDFLHPKKQNNAPQIEL